MWIKSKKVDGDIINASVLLWIIGKSQSKCMYNQFIM